ncbi:hypothetical protein L2D14_11645 [Thalassospiraceae bacterium LMO-JJ14]|nr:hypothetical protein L2D14_11645 [Thalassospiraceae bacterium LMO-JJ14]
MGTTDNAAVQAATQNLQSKSTAKSATKSVTSDLIGSVGMGAANAPGDVMKVSSALTANGLMEAPQSHADATLFKGIIGAQERMDGTLKRDGLVNPGGPTEQTFSRLAGQGFVKPAPAQPATPARPATGDAVLNAELRADAKQNAVAAAEARVKADLSDETRSDYRKAQDRHRLDKAREDAERAQARARHEEAEQRRRQREQQAAAQQKASTDARKQAIEARQAVSTGLTKIVHQAGKMLDEALNSSSRHSGPGSAPGTGSGRNPVSPDALDPGFRRNDGAVADGKTITLSDAAIAANRRTADALKRRTTVGDLPRFTVDAINTDGTKAVHEVADMIEQVHASDPEQAQELFGRTAQGIGAEDRTRLEELLRGGVISEFPPDRLPGQPMDGSLPDRRTKVLRLEDLDNPDDARRDMLHRPGQEKPGDVQRDLLYRPDRDKPEMMPLKAKAETGMDQHSAAPDTGEPSAPQDAPGDIWNIPEQPMTEGGAAYVQPGDAEAPSGHGDQIEGQGVGADEQKAKIESALDALGEIEAAQRADEHLDKDRLEKLRDSMDRGFAFDTDARRRAHNMVDALQRGDKSEAGKIQAELNGLAHDPVRRRAQQESATYYRRTTEAERTANAEARGKHRMAYEDAFVGLAVNAAQLEGAEFKADFLANEAAKGDRSAKAALPAARERVDGIRQRMQDGAQKVRAAAAEYARIPRPPHPEIDHEGAAHEEKLETRARRKEDTIDKAASAAIGVGGAVKGPAMGAVAAAPAAATAFSQALRKESMAAARRDGVDITDPNALAEWAEKHPEAGHDAIERAFQFGIANFVGSIGGDAVGSRVRGIVGDIVGFGTDQAIDQAIRPDD